MTSGTTVHGVRVLGEGVPYLDGAEDRLYDIITAAPDRSTASDDLARGISDWPTRYHLSRLRPNILLPLQIGPGMRVLDVGCGTGVLSRAMAERGAEVTGLEGSLARARAAAARVRGLSNCEIVCGSLAEYEADEDVAGTFDAVLLCGVLEYSGSAIGGAGGPQQMLAEVQSLLKPGGVAIIAIENQIGLKYLLGYPEDHRGLPWVGIDGYRSGRNPAQTWSRAALSELLAGTGLTEQQWLLPYPDYKLPTVVARAELFDSQQGRDIARLFLRNPVVDHSATSMLTADPVSAFQTMLQAGIAADTANSFLVVAGREGSDPNDLIADGQLWISSGERRAELMDRRVVRESADGWTMVAESDRAEVHMPPLVSRRSDVPVVLGTNLEDEIVALASRATAPEELAPLLQEWWAEAQTWLQPGDYHFDIMPRNFIRQDSGELAYIDREWVWAEDAPAAWALLRAMVYLVRERLWAAGAMAGLSWSLTVRDAALALAKLVDHRLTAADVESAIALEAQLQSRVGGADVEGNLVGVRAMLDVQLLQLTDRPAMAQVLERPLISEEDAAERMQQAELRELQARDDVLGNQAQLDNLRWQVAELEKKADWLRRRRSQIPRSAMRRVKGKAKSGVKRLLA